MTISGLGCTTCIAWLAINALFLWKPVYNKKKDLIDNTITKTITIVRNVLNKVDAFIPKYQEITSKKTD